MSYRLINANALAPNHKEVNDMPCIYADLPNGLDGGYYDLARAERTCYSEYSDRWECSECGFLDAYVTADFINYCPNCGKAVKR